MGLCFLFIFFAKPNLIVNTDLLIIFGNYFSLICKAEILYPPQFYLKRSILIQDPWTKCTLPLQQLPPQNLTTFYSVSQAHWLQWCPDLAFTVCWWASTMGVMDEGSPLSTLILWNTGLLSVRGHKWSSQSKFVNSLTDRASVNDRPLPLEQMLTGNFI